MSDDDIEVIDDEPDNLGPAIDKVMETTSLARTPQSGVEPGGKAVQILVRAPEETRDRWKRAADVCGVSVTEFVRRVVDERVLELLDCAHPIEYRKRYPWSESCIRCGKRLR